MSCLPYCIPYAKRDNSAPIATFRLTFDTKCLKSPIKSAKKLAGQSRTWPIAGNALRVLRLWDTIGAVWRALDKILAGFAFGSPRKNQVAVGRNARARIREQQIARMSRDEAAIQQREARIAVREAMAWARRQTSPESNNPRLVVAPRDGYRV